MLFIFKSAIGFKLRECFFATEILFVCKSAAKYAVEIENKETLG